MRFLPSLLGATVALLVSGCSSDASATPKAPGLTLTYFTMPS